MFAKGETLYTIETDGSLYRVNAADGSWVQVGEAGAWQPTLVGAVLNGRLYFPLVAVTTWLARQPDAA